jgi:hypothetical protein
MTVHNLTLLFLCSFVFSCIALDAASDALVIAYHTNKYQEKVAKEKAENNGISTA